MECTARIRSSAPRLSLILARSPQRQPNLHLRSSLPPIRHASSSSSSKPPSKPSKDGPIVLEQPSKFNPPSHPQRLKSRSTTSMYGAGAAYNQGQTDREREASKTKKYPNMFPNEGSFMYWFLTNRQIHVFISLGVLLSLATFSFITTWAHNTPFAHLIPSASLLPLHPLQYISELWSVYRLHIDYTTARVAEARLEGILDARKRRLYRRAHGLEDLDKDEDEGVEIRGLVEWDDGLTNRERERGGVFVPVLSGGQAVNMGARPGEGMGELFERRKEELEERRRGREEERRRKEEEAEREERERLVRIGARPKDGEEPRRRKVWFGIWG